MDQSIASRGEFIHFELKSKLLTEREIYQDFKGKPLGEGNKNILKQMGCLGRIRRQALHYSFRFSGGFIFEFDDSLKSLGQYTLHN